MRPRLLRPDEPAFWNQEGEAQEVLLVPKGGECVSFCYCCGDCLRCYGDGTDCWWCTPDEDGEIGCQSWKHVRENEQGEHDRGRTETTA